MRHFISRTHSRLFEQGRVLCMWHCHSVGSSFRAGYSTPQRVSSVSWSKTLHGWGCRKFLLRSGINRNMWVIYSAQCDYFGRKIWARSVLFVGKNHRLGIWSATQISKRSVALFPTYSAFVISIPMDRLWQFLYAPVACVQVLSQSPRCANPPRTHVRSLSLLRSGFWMICWRKAYFHGKIYFIRIYALVAQSDRASAF